MAERSTSLGYRPALDGLRAIAIGLVVLHHTSAFLVPSWSHRFFPGGFLGVDLFFVLSGFLITTLLLERRGRESRPVVAFYVRRALRLLPAVVVLLLGVAALSIVTSANEDQIPVTFLVVLSYSTNWAELAGVHISQYVSHLWSLAIEEQFYLVWPLLLFAGLVLVGSRSRLVWVALTLALLAAAWRAALWESGEGWLRIYIRSDARADALLIGAALALAPWERLAAAATTRWRTFAGVFSLGCVIAAAEFIQPSSPSLYLGGLSVVAVLCAVSLAAVLVPGSALAAVLASVPLVLLGRVSYGLYLWHFPIFLYVGEHARTWPAGARVAFAWALAIAVTVFSYRVVEQPALRLRGRLSARLAENVQAAP